MNNCIKLKIYPLLLLFFLAGCCTKSPNLMELHNKFNEEQEMLSDADLKDVSKKKETLREFIEDASTFQTFDVYFEQLYYDVKALKNTSNTVISPDSLYGLPYYYLMRLDSIANAYMELAKLSTITKDYQEALDNCIYAEYLINDMFNSPHYKARKSIDVLYLKAKIYSLLKKPGMIKNTKFDIAILKDYLSSKQAAKDYYSEKHAQAISYNQRR